MDYNTTILPINDQKKLRSIYSFIFLTANSWALYLYLINFSKAGPTEGASFLLMAMLPFQFSIIFFPLGAFSPTLWIKLTMHRDTKELISHIIEYDFFLHHIRIIGFSSLILATFSIFVIFTEVDNFFESILNPSILNLIPFVMILQFFFSSFYITILFLKISFNNHSNSFSNFALRHLVNISIIIFMLISIFMILFKEFETLFLLGFYMNLATLGLLLIHETVSYFFD